MMFIFLEIEDERNLFHLNFRWQVLCEVQDPGCLWSISVQSGLQSNWLYSSLCYHTGELLLSTTCYMSRLLAFVEVSNRSLNQFNQLDNAIS